MTKIGKTRRASSCYEVMTNSLMKKGIMGLIPFIKFITQYNSIYYIFNLIQTIKSAILLINLKSGCIQVDALKQLNV
jgi:hypothetical protein